MPLVAVIVEDNVTSADVAARQIQALGFETRIAETAEAGFNLIQEIAPDLAIIDERLPDNSGTELVRALKKEMPGLTVIMSTVVNEDDMIRDAFEAGCNFYAVKPNGLRKLCANYSTPDLLLNPNAQEMLR